MLNDVDADDLLTLYFDLLTFNYDGIVFACVYGYFPLYLTLIDLCILPLSMVIS